MALRTKADVVEEIAYEVNGGLDSSDSRLDERFILRLVNETIAYLAKKSAFETNNLEGITYSSEVFTLTYNDIDVATDSGANLKYIELPVQPIGLPRQRAFNVYPNAIFGGVISTMFKPVGAHEVQSIRTLPKVPNTVWYFLQGNKIYFVQKGTGYMDKYKKMNLRVISSGGTSMSDPLNLPEDMIVELKQMVVERVRKSLFTPQDTISDGNDTKNS